MYDMKMCFRCIQYTLILQNTDRLKFAVNIITVHMTKHVSYIFKTILECVNVMEKLLSFLVL